MDLLDGLNKSTRNFDASNDAAHPWSYLGVGRDDGKENGEYSPVLYQTEVFRPVDNKTVWLSPTPDTPSKGWDAGSIRILTVGIFEYRQTSQRFVTANTHLDNAGSRSRLESIRIILRTLQSFHEHWNVRGHLPIFLTGDFNSLPTDEAYMEMKNSGYMLDLHDAIHTQDRYGEKFTFTGFEPSKHKDEQGRIDFIWLDPLHNSTEGDGRGRSASQEDQNPWHVDGYAVLPNVFDDGMFSSDHRAVVGDVQLPNAWDHE